MWKTRETRAFSIGGDTAKAKGWGERERGIKVRSMRRKEANHVQALGSPQHADSFGA